MTDTVPLNKLVISPRNVRKTDADVDVAGLADSIASKGLLQNLVVSPSADGKTFEVDAGGRRLRALQLLAERKDLPKNWPVPVKVIAVADARQASLAENLQKVSMNPADEVEAFDALIQDWTRPQEAEGDSATGNTGMGQLLAIANCSKRFGVTERYVRQRLALAALAPEILDALRDGTITIAAAQAYASHPDRDEQLKVFKAHVKRTGTYGKHDPREIRDSLKGRIYPVDHKLVRYVGLDAYRAAGGEVAADLFFDEDEREILLNPSLVDRLAAEKGAIEAQKLAQAEGWLDAELQPVTGHYWQMPKTPDGYTQRWVASTTEIPPEQRTESIALYGIGDEGKVEPHNNYIYVKIVAPVDAPPTRTREQAEAESRAQFRRHEILLRAARLATPKVAGTAFEGRAFWPIGQRWIEPLAEEPNGTIVVALLVKLAPADVEAQLAEAERRYDLEQEELREEEEALAAERAAAGPDDDGEEGDDNADSNVNDAAAEPETADA